MAGHSYLPIHGMPQPSLDAQAKMTQESLAATGRNIPLAVLPIYLKLLLWPTHLHMEHDLPTFDNLGQSEVWGGFLIAFVFAALVMRRQNKTTLPLSWGILWFMAGSSLLLTINRILYEHWMYLPAIGLFLGIAQTLASIGANPRFRYAGVGVALAIALVFGCLTYRQNTVWHDPETLFKNTLNYGEKAPRMHTNLGVFYAERGEYEKAVDQFKLSLQESDNGERRDDKAASVHTNLAATRLRMAQTPENRADALAHLKRALEIDPDYYPALTAIAGFYRDAGDQAQASFYQTKADQVRRNFEPSALH
jgi:tetratricopeptide (TPR) repeat protein